MRSLNGVGGGAAVSRPLALLLALGAALACGGSSGWRPGASVPRPDTRAYLGVRIDSLVGRALYRLFVADTADEVGVCIFGKDSLTAAGQKILVFTRVEKSRMAAHDSVSIHYAEAPCGDDPDGRPLVAMAHDHLHLAPWNQCAHSDPDADFLFNHPRLALLFLLCNDGRLEFLW